MILFLFPMLSDLFSFGKLVSAEVMLCLLVGFTTFGLFEAFRLDPDAPPVMVTQP